jgi:hypothetical protein
VSPSETSVAETLSTLQFAQRAKRIKNAAVVNENIRGNMIALQKEVLALRNLLAAYTSGVVPTVSPTALDTEELCEETTTAPPIVTSEYLDLPTQALICCRSMKEEKIRVEEQVKRPTDRIS